MMTAEQMNLTIAKAEKIRREADGSSAREAVRSHLRHAAASLPGRRFPDGRTPEEVTDRLLAGLSSMVPPSPAGGVLPPDLRTALRRVITEEKMDAARARQYVAAVGVLLEEMAGSAEWTDPAQARSAVVKKLQARLDKYDDLPLAEQIDRLISETPPALNPALARACRMNLLQELLNPLSGSRREEALSGMVTLCADRENALIAAALQYEKSAAGPGTVPDPAVFAVSAAYDLSVTEACAMELSGLMTMEESLDAITDRQGCFCVGMTMLAGASGFVAGSLSVIELGFALADALEMELLGSLVFPALAIPAGIVCLLAAAGAVAVTLPAAMRAWNTARNIRRLSAGPEADQHLDFACLAAPEDAEDAGAEENAKEDGPYVRVY